MTGLLLSNLCKKIVKKLIWKFIDIFPNQVLNFLNTFTEHEKIIAYYTKGIERISQLLCRNVIEEQLSSLRLIMAVIWKMVQWTLFTTTASVPKHVDAHIFITANNTLLFNIGNYFFTWKTSCFTNF